MVISFIIEVGLIEVLVWWCSCLGLGGVIGIISVDSVLVGILVCVSVVDMLGGSLFFDGIGNWV